jgi:hypothetical protein
MGCCGEQRAISGMLPRALLAPARYLV